MRSLIKMLWRGQYVSYGFIGVLNTFLDIGVYVILVTVVGSPPSIAQIFGYSVSMLNSYFMNRAITYKRTGVIDLKEFMQFLIVNMLSLGLSVLLLCVFHDLLGLGDYVSKLLTTGPTMIITFAGTHFWVFRSDTVSIE